MWNRFVDGWHTKAKRKHHKHFMKDDITGGYKAFKDIEIQLQMAKSDMCRVGIELAIISCQ